MPQIWPSWHLSRLFTVSLAFLASVSPPLPAPHTMALYSFVFFFFFFFCLVNKCIWSTHSRTTYGLSIVYG